MGWEDSLEEGMATDSSILAWRISLTDDPGGPQGASHGGSEKPGKLEVGGASRDSTGLGALEEGLISS